MAITQPNFLRNVGNIMDLMADINQLTLSFGLSTVSTLNNNYNVNGTIFNFSVTNMSFASSGTASPAYWLASNSSTISSSSYCFNNCIAQGLRNGDFTQVITLRQGASLYVTFTMTFTRLV